MRRLRFWLGGRVFRAGYWLWQLSYWLKGES